MNKNQKFVNAVNFIIANKNTTLEIIKLKIENIEGILSETSIVTYNDVLLLVDNFGVNLRFFFSENETILHKDITEEIKIQLYALSEEVSGLEFRLQRKDERIRSLEELNSVLKDKIKTHKIDELGSIVFSESVVIG